MTFRDARLATQCRQQIFLGKVWWPLLFQLLLLLGKRAEPNQEQRLK